MRVAILTSEAVPFAKTGGLADVSGALPKALKGTWPVDARLILPLYEKIDRDYLNGESVTDVRVEWRGQVHTVRFLLSDTAGAPAYLLEAPEFFGRPNIYGYQDDHIRFAFFSRAALALLKHLDWQPDVVHGNDWLSGFAMQELRARRRYDPFFQGTRTVLFRCITLVTRASLIQAIYGGSVLASARGRRLHDRARASALKAGIIAADALSTVSPRYAREIQTRDQGHGLDWLLRSRADRLAGITNGVDYEIWNPETDPHIAANFSVDDLFGKLECKIDLLRRFGLPEDPEPADHRRHLATRSAERLRPNPQAGVVDSCKRARSSSHLARARKSTKTFSRSGTIGPREVAIYKGYAASHWRIRSKRARICFLCRHFTNRAG
jgi:starch synthase